MLLGVMVYDDDLSGISRVVVRRYMVLGFLLLRVVLLFGIMV